MNTSSLIPFTTAGIEQTRVARGTSNRTESAQVLDRTTGLSTAAAVSSVTANDKQNQAINAGSAPVLNKEQIRVSSSMGNNDIRGNLTPEKATELYQKIAQLI